MTFGLNFISLSGILIAAASFFMATMMFSIGRDWLNRIFGIFCLAIFTWGISFYFLPLAESPEEAATLWKISHVGVILIPVLLLHIVYFLIGKFNYPLLQLSYATALVFLVIDLSSDLLINQMRFVFDTLYYDSPPGKVYLVFFFFFQILIFYAHYLMEKAYIGTKDKILRERIRYFFMATLVGFLGGSLSFLPVFEIDIYPGTIVTVALYPVILGYAILKYKLFDIRLVTAQIIALVISIYAFLKLFLSEDRQEFFVNGGILLVTLGLGIYLVMSVKKEVEAREHIELLAKDLEKANVRLRELDQQKSEFVSIASHQLRGPLTAIKGYASMILEGSFGRLEPKAREAVGRVYESTRHLSAVVEDLLSVTKIELGGMQFDFNKVDLKKLAHEIAAELDPVVKKAGLSLVLKDSGREHYYVSADYEKFRQVVANLVDNAVKYTSKGEITVSLSENDGKVKLSVADTGMGISEGLQNRLFEKFSRGEGISKVNTGGSGLGLYVAKEVVKAHGGRIWAESPGEGKGSTFAVELDAYKE